jgi:hypothetical protein
LLQDYLLDQLPDLEEGYKPDLCDFFFQEEATHSTPAKQIFNHLRLSDANQAVSPDLNEDFGVGLDASRSSEFENQLIPERADHANLSAFDIEMQ